MGFEETNSQQQQHLNRILILTENLITLKPSERISYIEKNFSSREIRILCEIVHNFMYGVVDPEISVVRKLKRVENELKTLSKKTTSLKVKKNILLSAKGAFILDRILPIIHNFLLEK